MARPEFMDLLKSWDISARTASRYWMRYHALLEFIDAEDLEDAFRAAIREVIERSLRVN